jgi:hypothetical protein
MGDEHSNKELFEQHINGYLEHLSLQQVLQIFYYLFLQGPLNHWSTCISTPTTISRLQ